MNAEETKVGCFQMVLVLLLGVNYVIVAMSHALPVFHNYAPKFYCQAKDSTNKRFGCQTANNSLVTANLTSSQVHLITSCSGKYHFVTEFTESSVVTEWGLVCEKQYLSHLGPIVYYAGVILGAWITGILTDRIGRFPVQAICLYAQGTMAVALYVVQNYPTFLALRGLQGVFVQGLQNSTYILSLELFPARFRTFVALMMQISWSIGLILLAVLSYVIPDWRILQLAISVPTAITVLYIWIIPESPRWLLAKGKSTEADMVLERIAIYNSCCTGLQKKNLLQEACVKSNTTPMKPERKSRVTSIELEKARANENQREETTDLLNKSKLIERKIIENALEINSTNSRNKFSNMELREKTKGDFDKKHLPSSSKCDQNSKTIAQSECEQKVAAKCIEEVVLRRVKKRKTDKNEEKSETAVKKQTANELSSTFKNAIKPSRLRRYSAIMICQWWASATADGISNNLAPSFPINRHITFGLGAILEMATYTFVYFILSNYGRRVPMCTYQSLNGIMYILIATFLIFITTTSPWTDLAKTIMTLFARVTVISTLSIVYLYSVEISPTVIRSTWLGLCVVCANLGNMSIILLLEYVSLPIQLLVVGSLCLVSGMLALILPETLNKVLPDQIADMKNAISSDNYKSGDVDTENNAKEEVLTKRQILREKLFGRLGRQWNSGKLHGK
ncbi:hypothetical protein PUN28_010449 [Cardiocondyla obscurior]|uniref:Major facilitator superfamily (MFS) profile domain-containing protein n=2 Tax=Cardiocondyla obscurior TaxID=286306 RepID=A0AAW2FGF5_9HYME